MTTLVALESGPCLICQRPSSPLRRPYGWLCDEHNNTNDANATGGSDQ